MGTVIQVVARACLLATVFIVTITALAAAISGPARAGTANYGYPGSAFRACVIARESGGNPRAVNPSSGAGGLYQFLPSTWRTLGFGGLPEYASIATQDAAFVKAYELWGTSPWSPYDHCTAYGGQAGQDPE
jgi:resuscitation-promoting factor RpfC